MAKKNYERALKLLCLLLICSFAFAPAAALSFGAAATSSSAFFENDGDFDYKQVMSEPTVDVGDNTQVLSPEILKSIKLYPGGVPFGVKFMTDGLLIVGFCDIQTGSGKLNPSSEAGLCIGDRITHVDGKKVYTAAELSNLINKSEGKPIHLTYRRNGNEYDASITPIFSKSENCYKSGAYVKDNGAGIGTVTYIVPNTLEFAGLGHGICEGENGGLVPISRGSVTEVSIDGAIKGQCGTPGELKGRFKSGKWGSLLKNTNCGVFGVMSKLPQGLPTAPLSLGLRDEIEEGKAFIYCTLDGNTPKKYEIEISSIDRGATLGKCFTVKVTDPALLEKTGGIVQGMSGSPIIQNGKLVGAVTHVMINDPTTGYGIFIENMLSASNGQIMPKAA